METKDKLMLYLARDFASSHTINSLAQELHLSRVGIWKILKALETKNLVHLIPVSKGKTSTFLITLQWENPMVEKLLSIALLEEALLQPRWRNNFVALEHSLDFLIIYGSILHSPNSANDIDLIGVVSQKEKLKSLDQLVLSIQKTQIKTIHALFFQQQEFRQELKNRNRAFLDALKKGVVLFGQDNFIQFIKEVQLR